MSSVESVQVMRREDVSDGVDLETNGKKNRDLTGEETKIAEALIKLTEFHNCFPIFFNDILLVLSLSELPVARSSDQSYQCAFEVCSFQVMSETIARDQWKPRPIFSVSKNKHRCPKLSTTFSCKASIEAISFHRRMPDYKPTPLVSLGSLAEHLGIKGIMVKDESHRFDLKAFKVLGGAYALAKVICEKLDTDISEFNFQTTPGLLDEPITFVTATAGNHGTGITWAAGLLNQKTHVLMPKGAPVQNVTRVQSMGAECTVTEVNYDDTVRLAEKLAHENGWVLVQDTAWKGYETIPTWISQGYMSMAIEAVDQILELGSGMPTHVMLQGGVGAMAGGVLGYLADRLGPGTFTTIISEPSAADCLKRSSESDKMVVVGGDLNSILRGLACGEVNPVTWEVLKNNVDHFTSVDDSVTATGMRILGNPLNGDEKVVSGCSGAINMGLLYTLLTAPEKEELKKQLGLNSESIVLIFSTEGDTNAELYREIVWGSKYRSES